MATINVVKCDMFGRWKYYTTLCTKFPKEEVTASEPQIWTGQDIINICQNLFAKHNVEPCDALGLISSKKCIKHPTGGIWQFSIEKYIFPVQKLFCSACLMFGYGCRDTNFLSFHLWSFSDTINLTWLLRNTLEHHCLHIGNKKGWFMLTTIISFIIFSLHRYICCHKFTHDGYWTNAGLEAPPHASST